MIEIGLLALAVGVAFDWQRLFPAIGDRVAALCALVVGQSLVAGTQLGQWVQSLGGLVSTWAGQLAGAVDGKFAGPVANLLLPLSVGILALLWVLAMIPKGKATTKVVGQSAGNQLSSGLIWAGTLLPVLAVSIPGEFGDLIRGLLDVATAAGTAGVTAVL